MSRHPDVAVAGLACVEALRGGQDTDAAVELIGLLQYPLAEVLAWLIDQVLLGAGSREVTLLSKIQPLSDLTSADLAATVAAVRRADDDALRRAANADEAALVVRLVTVVASL